MPEIEEKVESLETLLGRFIIHTDMSLNRLSKEIDRVSKETNISLANLSKETNLSLTNLSKEIDRVSKEVDRMSKEVDRVSNNIDKLGEQLAASDEKAKQERLELDRKWKEELAAYKEEARQERIEMNKRWGEIANKMGTLVEDMVAPNIKGIAKRYFGCEEFEDFMIRRQKRHSKDRTKRREFDIIAVCDESVIINETKSTPRINYIDDFIMTLKEFFDYFPEYKGKKVIPIFASLYLGDDVIAYLTKNNIYAMAIKEDTMDLLNFEDIKN